MSRKARKQKCNKYRKNQTNGDNYLRVIQGGALERQRNTKVTITPRNFNQDELLGLLEDRNINMVFYLVRYKRKWHHGHDRSWTCLRNIILQSR